MPAALPVILPIAPRYFIFSVFPSLSTQKHTRAHTHTHLQTHPHTHAQVSELLRHPLVFNALLDEQQRLGTHAADPAEISLELNTPTKAKQTTTTTSRTQNIRTQPQHSAQTSPEGKQPPLLGGLQQGGPQGLHAEEPHSLLAPGIKRPLVKGRAMGGAMGGVVLREVADEEEDESSCSSDDGDDDGARTPVAEALHLQTHLRKGAHTMPHPINEFATGGELGGGSRRPLPESVSQDVDCALQIVGQAHLLVQSVTSNRQKCFSLAQKMRRAKIPLERLLEQGGCEDHAHVRNAVMDLRYVIDSRALLAIH